MLGSYFSPLAPAAILLLGAFILPLVALRLPAHWQRVREFSPAALVGVALLSLLGVRVTFGPDGSGQGLEILSGWNFSTTESVAALTVRTDPLGLPFLITVGLVLLAVSLLPVDDSARNPWQTWASWLAIGGGACLLFVSANGLTLIYALMLFDALTGFYWWRNGDKNWGVARLFLGVFTATGLVVASLTGSQVSMLGWALLGLALWLRLGFYPFIETNRHAVWPAQERLTYLALTMAAGIFLTIRVVTQPQLLFVNWLVVMIMLLSGLLAWLTPALSPPGDSDSHLSSPTSLLVWLIITESLFILLAGPLPTGLALAFAVGLVLSLVALWVTPALGRPKLGERAWSWPYLPAIFSTFTLLGLPFSLGWPARLEIYHALFRVESVAIIIITLLAQALALSGLVRYWLILWRGQEQGERRLAVGIVAMVPFLTPGLGPFVLTGLAGVELSAPGSAAASGPLLAWGAIILAAVGLGYFRHPLLARFNSSVEFVQQILALEWLLVWVENYLAAATKVVLRVRVMLEGQHYIGWAIFLVLVGALIILLD